MKYLIDHGATIDTITAALPAADAHNKLNAIEYLVYSGADPTNEIRVETNNRNFKMSNYLKSLVVKNRKRNKGIK